MFESKWRTPPDSHPCLKSIIGCPKRSFSSRAVFRQMKQELLRRAPSFVRAWTTQNHSFQLRPRIRFHQGLRKSCKTIQRTLEIFRSYVQYKHCRFLIRERIRRTSVSTQKRFELVLARYVLVPANNMCSQNVPIHRSCGSQKLPTPTASEHAALRLARKMFFPRIVRRIVRGIVVFSSEEDESSNRPYLSEIRVICCCRYINDYVIWMIYLSDTAKRRRFFNLEKKNTILTNAIFTYEGYHPIYMNESFEWASKTIFL